MKEMEKLIWEFLENKEFVSNLYWEYKEVINYYDEIHWFWFNGSKIIYDFIKWNYSKLLTKQENISDKDIKQLIINILNYNFQDYCYQLINEKNKFNYFAYSVFYSYNYIDASDFQGIDLVDDAKNNAYNIIFLKIQKEFILFLENKILNKNCYVEDLNSLDELINNLWNCIDNFIKDWDISKELIPF